MASNYVRTTVKGWMATLGVPFYNTVAEEQDPADPVWTTVDWGYGQNERVDFCTVEENGSFSVAFFGAAGEGDAALMAVAEAAMASLMASVDPTARLVLVNFDPPTDFYQGRFYGLEFNVDYECRP